LKVNRVSSAGGVDDVDDECSDFFAVNRIFSPGSGSFHDSKALVGLQI
jgi:hypothetical protein